MLSVPFHTKWVTSGMLFPANFWLVLKESEKPGDTKYRTQANIIIKYIVTNQYINRNMKYYNTK